TGATGGSTCSYDSPSPGRDAAPRRGAAALPHGPESACEPPGGVSRVRPPGRAWSRTGLARSERRPAMSRVLIVGDNPDGRMILRLLLEHYGHQVEEAADGREGVEKALAWQPEVAFVDIGLPVCDGFEVARQVKAALGGRVVLVALTAYDGPEDGPEGV